MTSEDVEKRLILGPGWIERFESGEAIPSLDVLLALTHALGSDLRDLLAGIDLGSPAHELARQIDAEQVGNDLRLRFRYGQSDAAYRLEQATLEDFEEVLKTLRDGLARLAGSEARVSEAIKTDSVARAFLKAVVLWPHANPSDLWWFLVSRAYCDPFNHPAAFARLDLGQSWKRTGGWALEEVLVQHYRAFLNARGVDVVIATGERKAQLVGQLDVGERVEADKVDVLLTGTKGGREICFGAVHVKASFAERRTDDVPLSTVLIEGGYCSPLWTMDCKSTPSEAPRNRGELGAALTKEADRRSAKRKDIEDDGYFSACFSYNRNTVPTPDWQAAKARIHLCDFSNPDDRFSAFLLSEWERFIR